MTSIFDFAATVKRKYPAYQDVDDITLTRAMLEKYPVYRKQVDLTGYERMFEGMVEPAPANLGIRSPAPESLIQTPVAEATRLAAAGRQAQVEPAPEGAAETMFMGTADRLEHQGYDRRYQMPDAAVTPTPDDEIPPDWRTHPISAATQGIAAGGARLWGSAQAELGRQQQAAPEQDENYTERLTRGQQIAKQRGIDPASVDYHGNIPNITSEMKQGMRQTDVEALYTYLSDAKQQEMVAGGKRMEQAGKEKLAAAEVLDPSWLRLEKLRDKVTKVEQAAPGVVRAWRKGQVAQGLDELMFDAYLAGDDETVDKVLRARQDFFDVAEKADSEQKKRDGFAQLLDATVEMLPAMGKGAALNAIPVIGPVLSTSMWARQGAGSMLAEMAREGIPREVALPIALSAGLAYGMVEQAQVSAIAGSGGLSKALQDAIGKRVKNRVLGVIAERGIGWAQENIEEVVQGVIEEGAFDLARGATGAEFDPGEMAQRYSKLIGETFMQSAGPMGLLSAAGVRGSYKRVGEAQRAQRATEREAAQGPSEGAEPTFEVAAPGAGAEQAAPTAAPQSQQQQQQAPPAGQQAPTEQQAPAAPVAQQAAPQEKQQVDALESGAALGEDEAAALMGQEPDADADGGQVSTEQQQDEAPEQPEEYDAEQRAKDAAYDQAMQTIKARKPQTVDELLDPFAQSRAAMQDATPQQRAEFANLVEQATNKVHWSPGSTGPGTGQGVYGRTAFDNAVKHVLENREQFGDAVIVSFDMGNQGGGNTQLGHDEMNRVIWETDKRLMEKVSAIPGAKAALYKTGGDEASIIVYGADQAAVEQALSDAQQDIEQYREQQDLTETPHPKHDGLPTGVGYVNIGIASTSDLESVKADLQADGIGFDSDAQALLKKADRESYDRAREYLEGIAQRTGHVFDEETGTFRERTSAAMQGLTKALKSGKLTEEEAVEQFRALMRDIKGADHGQGSRQEAGRGKPGADTPVRPAPAPADRTAGRADAAAAAVSPDAEVAPSPAQELRQEKTRLLRPDTIITDYTSGSSREISFTPEFEALSSAEKRKALTAERRAIKRTAAAETTNRRDRNRLEDLYKQLGRYIRRTYRGEAAQTQGRREQASIDRYIESGKPTNAVTRQLAADAQTLIDQVESDDLYLLLDKRYSPGSIEKARDAIRKGNKDGAPAKALREEVAGWLRMGYNPDAAAEQIEGRAEQQRAAERGELERRDAERRRVPGDSPTGKERRKGERREDAAPMPAFQREEEQRELQDREELERLGRRLATNERGRSRLVAQLRGAVARGTGVRRDKVVLRPAESPGDADAKAAGEVARLFGKEIVWYTVDDSSDAAAREVTATYWARFPGVVFLNTDRHVSTGLSGSVGHELFHAMRDQHPDLFDQFATLAREHVSEEGIRQVQRTAPVHRSLDIAEEELYADFAGDVFRQRSFWEDLRERAPEVFKAAARELARILDAILGTDLEGLSDRYFNDARSMRDMLSEVMGEYAERERESRRMMPEGGAAQQPVIQFQRRPSPDGAPAPGRSRKPEWDERAFVRNPRQYREQFRESLREWAEAQPLPAITYSSLGGGVDVLTPAMPRDNSPYRVTNFKANAQGQYEPVGHSEESSKYEAFQNMSGTYDHEGVIKFQRQRPDAPDLFEGTEFAPEAEQVNLFDEKVVDKQKKKQYNTTIGSESGQSLTNIASREELKRRLDAVFGNISDERFEELADAAPPKSSEEEFWFEQAWEHQADLEYAAAQGAEDEVDQILKQVRRDYARFRRTGTVPAPRREAGDRPPRGVSAAPAVLSGKRSEPVQIRRKWADFIDKADKDELIQWLAGHKTKRSLGNLRDRDIEQLRDIARNMLFNNPPGVRFQRRATPDKNISSSDTPAKEEGVKDIAQLPEFKRWFGDSKVVNEDGSPKVMYHGSSEGGLEAIEPGYDEPGAWFTNKKTASSYAKGINGEIYSVYLNARNPLVVEFDERMVPEVDGAALDLETNVDIVEYAQKNGYDSVHFPYGNFSEDDDTWVVFSRDQIRLKDDDAPRLQRQHGPSPEERQAARPKPPVPAEAEQKAQAWEREARRIRAKLRNLPEQRVVDRAKLERDLREYDRERHDIIMNAVYDYARKLGLRGVAYNQVDTLLRKSRTAAGLRRAVETMDRRWSRAINSALRKKVLDTLAKTKMELRRAAGKGRHSSRDATINRKILDYIDRITTAPESDWKTIDQRLAWVIDNPEQDMPESMEKQIKAVFARSIGEMTNPELVQVLSDIRSLKQAGRTRAEIIEEARKQDKDAAVTNAVKEIRAPAAKHPLKEAAEKEGPFANFAQKIADYGWGHIRPERIIEWFAHWKPASRLKHAIFDPILKAENTKMVGVKKALDHFKRIHNDIDIQRAMSTPYLSVMFEQESPEGEVTRDHTTLTIENMMFVYAHSQNPGNLAHLHGTGFTPEMIDQIIQALPQQYRDAVDAMIDYYDTVQYPRMNKVFEDEHGVPMPHEHRYFPIQNVKTTRAENAVVADMLARMSSKNPSVQKGSTRLRVGSESAFKKMEYFSGVVRNLMDVEQYIAYNGPVRQVNAILNDKRMREAMESRSKVAASQVRDWLKAAAYGKVRGSENPLDRWTEWLRLNYSTAVLGLNVVTMMKQTASLPVGIRQVKKPHLVRGARDIIMNRKKVMAEMFERSPMMANRMDSFERELAEMAEKRAGSKVLGMQGMADKVKEAAMHGIGVIDMAAAAVIWQGKYLEQMAKTPNPKAAAAAADEVVRKTQSQGGIVHLSKMYRAGGIARAYTMFTNDANQRINLLFETFSSPEKKLGDRAEDVFWYLMVPSVIMYMASHGGRLPWDDPEGWAQQFLEDLWGGFVLVNQVLDAAALRLLNESRKARGAKSQGGQLGFLLDFAPPSMGALEDAGYAAYTLDPWKIAEFGAKITGTPYAQVKRTAKGAKTAYETGDWRYLIWSEYALRDMSVDEAMRSRVQSPRGWEDRIEFLKWYNDLSPEKRQAFEASVPTWEKDKARMEKSLNNQLAQFRRNAARARKTLHGTALDVKLKSIEREKDRFLEERRKVRQ